MAIVLIVDDAEALRVLAESVLEELGHHTLSAADPVEALAVQAANEIDLLFTDLNMGGEPHAGTTLAVDARGRQPGLAVLYTSGEGITDGTRALFVDGSEFLTKPYTVDGLRTALAGLLAQNS